MKNLIMMKRMSFRLLAVLGMMMLCVACSEKNTKTGKTVVKEAKPVETDTLPPAREQLQTEDGRPICPICKIIPDSPYYCNPDIKEVVYSKDTLYYFPRHSDVTDFTVPKRVRYIGERAFLGCDNLMTVTIPSTVKEIWMAAFSGCDALRKVVIEGGVKEIPFRGFEWCPNLTEITIPASVKLVCDMAFTSDKNLRHIYLKGATPPEIEVVDMGPFYEVDKSKCVIHVPKGRVKAYRKAEGWKEFKNITD